MHSGIAGVEPVARSCIEYHLTTGILRVTFYLRSPFFGGGTHWCGDVTRAIVLQKPDGFYEGRLASTSMWIVDPRDISIIVPDKPAKVDRDTLFPLAKRRSQEDYPHCHEHGRLSAPWPRPAVAHPGYFRSRITDQSSPGDVADRVDLDRCWHSRYSGHMIALQQLTTLRHDFKCCRLHLLPGLVPSVWQYGPCDQQY